MAKFSKKIAEVIVELVEADMSVTEICNAIGITRKTFYEWKNTKPDFSDAIDEARNRAYDELIVLARRTLRERIEGYTVEETTYTYEPSAYDEEELVLKKKVVKTKRKEPSITSLNSMVQRVEEKKQKKENQSKAIPFSAENVGKGLVLPRNSEEALVLARFYEQLERVGAEAEKKVSA